jgi:pyruvate/2-oxoglutarate dehydrogenase complex dihydrolipoamide acyltransferase (E2) component
MADAEMTFAELVRDTDARAQWLAGAAPGAPRPSVCAPPPPLPRAAAAAPDPVAAAADAVRKAANLHDEWLDGAFGTGPESDAATARLLSAAVDAAEKSIIAASAAGALPDALSDAYERLLIVHYAGHAGAHDAAGV